MNSKSKIFIESVEELVWKHDLTYMDAIVLHCENNSIEVESVASIIKNNDYMKAKLELEAEALHLIPKTARLPI